VKASYAELFSANDTAITLSPLTLQVLMPAVDLAFRGIEV